MYFINLYLFRSQKERDIRHKIKKGDLSGIPDDMLKNLPSSFFSSSGNSGGGGGGGGTGGSKGNWAPPKFDDMFSRGMDLFSLNS